MHVRLFRFDNSIAVPRKWLTRHQIKRYKGSTLGILHEPEEEGHFLEALGSLSEGGAYLNIGAAWGYYSLLAKKTRPDLDVFAVEAHPKMCSRIFEGSMINGVNGISVFNSAVVGKDGLNDGPMKIKFGHNGSGKTTLLRTISNQDKDVGDITFAPALRLAFLTQVRDIDDEATLGEELSRRGRQFLELEEEISEIEGRMEEPSFYEGDWQPTMERYQELQSLMARSGGGDVAGHATEILKALNLDQSSMEVPLNSLSGGERAKVALARQLVGLDQIDVFFLDEPTNHLDFNTLEWLERFLNRFEGALMIVSHDRYFLDRVCNNIAEVQDAHIRGYPGNYTSYLKQKEIFLQTLNDRIEKTQKEIKRLQGAMQSMKRSNKFDK